MPHVEIRGPIDLPAVHARFAPRTLREGTTVTKATASYLSHDGKSVLQELTVVEGFLHQTFFIVMTTRDGGIMVRLLPRTSPEKTPGVKRAVVWVASSLRAGCPASSVGRTNLAEFLDPAFSSDPTEP